MLRRKVREKIITQRGETLVEALVSILISTLALLMLATAITSTMNIVTTCKDTMNDYYDAQKNVVKQTNATVDGSVTCAIEVKTSSSSLLDSLSETDLSTYENDTLGSNVVVSYS